MKSLYPQTISMNQSVKLSLIEVFASQNGSVLNSHPIVDRALSESKALTIGECNGSEITPLLELAKAKLMKIGHHLDSVVTNPDLVQFGMNSQTRSEPTSEVITELIGGSVIQASDIHVESPAKTNSLKNEGMKSQKSKSLFSQKKVAYFDSLSSSLYIDDPEVSNLFTKLNESNCSTKADETLKSPGKISAPTSNNKNQIQTPYNIQNSSEDIEITTLKNPDIATYRLPTEVRVTCYDKANDSSPQPDVSYKPSGFINSPIAFGKQIPVKQSDPPLQTTVTDFDTLKADSSPPVKTSKQKKTRGRPRKMSLNNKTNAKKNSSIAQVVSPTGTLLTSKPVIKCCEHNEVKLLRYIVPQVKQKKGRPRKIQISENVSSEVINSSSLIVCDTDAILSPLVANKTKESCPNERSTTKADIRSLRGVGAVYTSVATTPKVKRSIKKNSLVRKKCSQRTSCVKISVVEKCLETTNVSSKPLDDSATKVKQSRGRQQKTITCEPNDAQVAKTNLNVSNGNIERTYFQSVESSSSSLTAAFLVTHEDLKSKPVRKSERIRKRKFEHDPTEEHVNNVDLNVKPAVQLPSHTNKKGRPKKHFKNSNAEKVNIEHSKELAHDDNQKCFRKLRAQKYVKYADLNSGIDSSESIDEALDVRDKVQDVNSSDNCRKETEKVLPLKKRKQKNYNYKDFKISSSKATMQETEVLKQIGFSKSKLEISTKLEFENKEKEIDDKDRSSKKKPGAKKKLLKLTAKLQKTQDSSDSITTDDRDSDFTVKKKGQIKSKNVLKKKTSKYLKHKIQKKKDPKHSQINVSNEKKDTSQAIKKKYNATLCQRRKSYKKFNQNASTSLSHDTIDFIGRMKEFHSRYDYKEIFQNLKPRKCMWKILNQGDSSLFLPPLKNSILMKIRNKNSKNETEWFKLKCFESAPNDDKSHNFTFFTGGPIWSSAWCPTPFGQRSTNYIAIATSGNLNQHKKMTATNGEKGLLQLWDVGHLDEKKLGSKPILRFCISHCHGIVWAMTWCPSGCWEEVSENIHASDILARLGLLAVACSDSYVRIYSIPQPSALKLEDDCPVPIYCSYPSVVLRPLCAPGPCKSTKKTMCVSICWGKTDNCNYIAGGYGNGMINIWQINKISKVLTKDTDVQHIIHPYKVFHAHGAAVSCLCFAPLPGHRWLASGSLDTTIKFWDLMDTSQPVVCIKKGSVQTLEWLPHLCGIFSTLDDCSIVQSATLFKECKKDSQHVLCCHDSCIQATSVSPWLNIQVFGEAAGLVSACFAYDLGIFGSQKYPIFHSYLELLAPDQLDDSNEIMEILNEIIDVTNALGVTVKSVENEDIENSSRVIESVIEDMILNLEGQLSPYKLSSHKRYTDMEFGTRKIHEPEFNYSQIAAHSSSSSSHEFSQDCDTDRQTLLAKNVESIFSDCKIQDSECSDNPLRLSFCGAIILTCDTLQNEKKCCSNMKNILIDGKLKTSEESGYIHRNEMLVNQDIIASTSEDLNARASSKFSNSNKVTMKSQSNQECNGIFPDIIHEDVPKDTADITENFDSQGTPLYTSAVPLYTISSVENEKITTDHTSIENIMEHIETQQNSKMTNTSVVPPQDVPLSNVPAVEISCRTKNIHDDYSEKSSSEMEEVGDFYVVSASNSPKSDSDAVQTANVGTSPDDDDNERNIKIMFNEHSSESLNNLPTHIIKEKPQLTYQDVERNYGLVFDDYDQCSVNGADIKDNMCSWMPSNPTLYHQFRLCSINTVEMNPNFGCHLWLFTAGQSGVARLTCVSKFQKIKPANESV